MVFSNQCGRVFETYSVDFEEHSYGAKAFFMPRANYEGGPFRSVHKIAFQSFVLLAKVSPSVADREDPTDKLILFPQQDKNASRYFCKLLLVCFWGVMKVMESRKDKGRAFWLQLAIFYCLNPDPLHFFWSSQLIDPPER